MTCSTLALCSLCTDGRLRLDGTTKRDPLSLIILMIIWTRAEGHPQMTAGITQSRWNVNRAWNMKHWLYAITGIYLTAAGGIDPSASSYTSVDTPERSFLLGAHTIGSSRAR